MTAAVDDLDRRTAPSSASGPKAERQRVDIQGLRAVAVLLVLLWHAHVPGVSGGFVGVDVFFVISGFLITGLIVREVESTGHLSLRRFYARRIRRLLPAAAVVLAFTLVVTALVLPVTRWSSTALDVVASAGYVVNWRLAAQSVDYLASEQALSPVQHYWSLAVEEQFYVVWPLLILLALAVHRRVAGRDEGRRRALAVGLALIALPSLAWSWHLTSTSPGTAYFVTTTRLWELALGAALALGAGHLVRLRAGARTALAAGGLVAIAVAAVRYDVSTPFPGLAALLPTLGALAVLAAGTGGSSRLGEALGAGPMRVVGDMSYSLYLWHWPVLVGGTAAWAATGEQLDWPTAAALTAASAVPAWLTYRLVERPVHHSAWVLARSRRVLAVLAVCTLLPVAGGVALAASVDRSPAPAPADLAGAAALGDDPASDPDGVAPEQVDLPVSQVLAAVDDNADVYDDGCHQDQASAEVLSCTYGDPGSDRVVALVGDSHAAQWQPALQEIAEERGWRLQTYSKSACGFFDLRVAVGSPPVPYESCSQWNAGLLAQLLLDRPDLVVATGSNSYSVYEGGERITGEPADRLLAEGYARQWGALEDAGVPVVALANTPWVDIDVPECLAASAGTALECAQDRTKALDKAGEEQRTAADASGVPLVDLNPWICPAERCSPVIGGTVVWRDSHHLTATYARTLAPLLEAELEELGLL